MRHPSAATTAVAKPSNKSTVAEIKAYLDKNGISYLASATKAELLSLIG